MNRSETSPPQSHPRKIEEILSQQGLPANLDAERAFLGAVLVNNDLVDEALDSIRQEDLASPSHQRIFRAVYSLRAENLPIDVVTLTERLQRTGELEATGGAEYISDLATGMPFISTTEHYIRIIRDRALLRDLIARANQIVLEAYSSPDEPAKILARAERSVLEVGSRSIKSALVGMDDLVPKTLSTFDTLLQHRNAVTGVATKFQYLDDMTSGLQPSDLIILAARPSVGKTAFALSLARNAAREEKIVALFSLEMSAEQIVFRLLSIESKVDLKMLRNGTVPRGDQQEVIMCFDRLQHLPLFVDDSPNLTLLDMGAKLRRLKASKGRLDLVVVDYLQLMSGIGRSENRNQEVSAISRGLKALAKELRVPVVALSQLSRAPEKRGEGKEPILSDLRDSGSIEQDADLVMFLHRSMIPGREETEQRGKAKLIIAKQRNGPTGVVELRFLEHLAQFANSHPGFPEEDSGG